MLMGIGDVTAAFGISHRSLHYGARGCTLKGMTIDGIWVEEALKRYKAQGKKRRSRTERERRERMDHRTAISDTWRA